MTSPLTPEVMERVGMFTLVSAFDAAYEAEWERVAELNDCASGSGAADRAATEAGIKAVLLAAAAVQGEREGAKHE